MDLRMKKNNFFLFSFRVKFIAAQVLSILVTVLVLGVSTHHQVDASNQRLLQEKLEAIAFGAKNRIETALSDLQTLLIRIDSRDFPNPPERKSIQRQFESLAPDLPVLGYINQQGAEEIKFVQGHESRELGSYQGSSSFQQALLNPNRVILSVQETDPDLTEPVLVLTLAKTEESSQEIQGVLRAAIPLKKLLKQFDVWPSGHPGKLMLLDDQMRYLIPPEPNLLFAPVIADSDSDNQAIARLGNHRDGTGEARLGQDRYRFAHAPLDSTGWVIIAATADETVGILTHLLETHIGISFIGLAFGILLSLALTLPMVRNIRKIGQQAHALAEEVTHSCVEVHSGDELQDLAHSINTLSLHRAQTGNASDHLDLMLHAILDPLLVADETGRVTKTNAAALQLFDGTEEQLLGSHLSQLFDEQSPLGDKYILGQLLDRGEMFNFETSIRRMDTGAAPVLLSCNRTSSPGSDAPIIVLTLKDISERKRAEKEIARLAYYDSLTGLPNRELLRNRLEIALAQQDRLHAESKTCLAILFLDLDHFKVVNDTLGHHMGDQLLQRASKRLQKSLRRSDTICRPEDPKINPRESDENTLARLGGDEFVILLPYLKSSEAISIVARRIIEDMARPFKLDQHEVFTPASIGIAVYPGDGEDCDSLLQHADIAMYHAKSQGRNSFHFFSREMNAAAKERLILEHRLRACIDKREGFSVRFQPKVALDDGRVCGMEVLLRWHDLTLGDVSPTRFIPISEETGLIIPLGEWVLEMACQQTREWIDRGCAPLKVAVNLSGRQLRQPDIVEMVARVLDKTGLAPELLELELTESMLMETVEETITLLHKLKDLGISLAIDDFGTGYSSLSYLKRFPIDTLKIDRSFICELESEGEDAAIVRAIISMARSLNLEVVAEGVETNHQRDFLKTNGCHQYQGYLFSQPVSAQNFASAFLKT